MTPFFVAKHTVVAASFVYRLRRYVHGTPRALVCLATKNGVILFLTVVFCALTLTSTAAAWTFPAPPAPKPEIMETVATTPGLTKDSVFQTQVAAPTERGQVGFGGAAVQQNAPICGPSSRANSLQCIRFSSQGGLGQSTLPFFGPLSTKPLLYQGDWLLGTSRGILTRVSSDEQELPDLKNALVGLWGAHARQMVHQPKSLDPATSSTLRWTFSSAAPFAGTPLIFDNKVYVVSLNHYVQALDWGTGKPLWAGRLSSETSLNFTNNSLTVTPEGTLLVGTPQGSLVAYDALTGREQWKASFPFTSSRLNSAVVASPLVHGQWVVVSQAGAKTQGILRSEGNRTVWQVDLGSVTSPVLAPGGQDIFLGVATGRVARLGLEDGRLLWQTPTLSTEPFVAMMLVNETFLLAATGDGELFLIHTQTGAVQTTLSTYGQVVGNFLQVESLKEWSQGCLSYASARLRCFWVKNL